MAPGLLLQPRCLWQGISLARTPPVRAVTRQEPPRIAAARTERRRTPPDAVECRRLRV